MNDIHWTFEDTLFLYSLESGAIPLAYFSHSAHIRLVWITLEEFPGEKATEVVCERILKFLFHHKKTKMFNAQLTVEAVCLIKYYKEHSGIKDCKGFLWKYPEFITDFKSLLMDFMEKR